MPLSDFTADLPAEKQEAFKAELGKYAEVSAIDKHPEFQRQLSLKHETTMANWQKEKLPQIIEDEIKRRGTKDPATIEIEKLRAEIAEERRNGLLKERKNQAIVELTKHGIDPDLAEFVITDDEAKFGENIGRLVGKVTSYRDSALKAEKEKIYGTKPPKGGETSAKVMPEAEFVKLPPKEQAAFMAAGGSLA